MNQNKGIGEILSASVSRELVDVCKSVLEKSGADVVFTTGVRNEFHPYRAKVVGGDGYLKCAVEVPDGASSNRQDLEDAHFVDGLVCVYREDKFPDGVVEIRNGVKVVCVTP